MEKFKKKNAFFNVSSCLFTIKKKALDPYLYRSLPLVDITHYVKKPSIDRNDTSVLDHIQRKRKWHVSSFLRKD